ncbi:unnamed protein product [Pleuronectes platessa]|uniref:Acid-sensing ion channel 2 n=1 Tax=Pleuronectes platessa TaxID=8262 RepID=A0A9N7YWL0_PLEPL|nr:unnamed protein product [Pleuronectes platessa]
MDLKESCGSQGSQESSSLHPTSWQAFAHTSTLHGLRFVFPYGQPSVRRLLWAAALLACLGLLALESAERLAYFLSYPHVTSVDAVVSGSLVFPAVTICNLNAYRFSRLTRNDLYHAGELMAMLDVHLKIPQPHLAEPDVLAFLQEKANFTKYKPATFSMKEFTERVGHDLGEMMLYCRYQGQECSHSDFQTPSYNKTVPTGTYSSATGSLATWPWTTPHHHLTGSGVSRAISPRLAGSPRRR